MHAHNDTAPLICGECGEGNYTPQVTLAGWSLQCFDCTVCEHKIGINDIDINDGESVEVDGGILHLRASSL